MEKSGKILIIDDNEDVLLSLSLLLRPRVEEVRMAKAPERIDEFMDSFCPDVIILDMNFRHDAVSGEEGYEWLAHILKRDPQAVVLLMTAFVDTAKTVRAIKAGAIDFIPKPWDKERLLDTVASAVELRRARAEEHKTPSAPVLSTDSGIIASSPAMCSLLEKIHRVAPTDANVLIMGENGTGKDVIARLIHSWSLRSEHNFASIDVGTISESLFESELFGYEKGAFTDAKASKAGRIEQADGGTLFLDEIGNLSLPMQQKLLTMIEKREYSRVGGTKTLNVNVRLIAATNAQLSQRVSDGTFRQDLFYRLNTIELYLPPLRQRGDDIILLAEHFARLMAAKYGKGMPEFTPEALGRLMSYSWPGNVRELQHTIERAIIMAPQASSASGTTSDGQPALLIDENSIAIETGNASAAQTATSASAPAALSTLSATNYDSHGLLSAGLNLAELERQAIMRAIELHNGNLTLAAEALGISRYTLYRKIDKMDK